MRWVALMPLRGNSESPPGNSARNMAGRPLFAWTLEQALAAECFDTIYITTASPEIRQKLSDESLLANKRVEVLDYSDATGAGTGDIDSALFEFQQHAAFDVVCLIQATSPLTRAEDFRAAKHQFLAEDLDSLLTAVQSKRFFWTRTGTPVDHDPMKRSASQNRKGYAVENGAFYLTRAKWLKDHGCHLGGRIGIHEMAAETAIDIGDEAGWSVVERLLAKQKLISATARASQVKALVLDVDGTLTDAGMYYGPAGEALKKFNTRDAHGLQLLREKGVSVCIISTEDSPAVAARMRKLHIDEYYPGIRNKFPLLLELAQRWGISLLNIAYIGDDLSDLECLSHVGTAFCPADAVPEILRQAHYVCECSGGHGAVREVCDLILKSSEGTPCRDLDAEKCQ
ncbi:N-acylneuraminate cytidylyltransferase [Nitrosovibrio tenuis]|uniref:3-deoxy-D-manno-octulosonate 8-phosphate phosphatase KdsC n=1 Tax=Nitrosovibrio tenuis TaxID=1233 RepID=A0A1H7PJL8_9PROT|nr:N-acylneuraminate cytidylyltransferase [Nitrosovibrio tenuis]SEL35972.1 N-acylneuraminate cytidylyltransferase [Nitrosovibrio tenuis]